MHPEVLTSIFTQPLWQTHPRLQISRPMHMRNTSVVADTVGPAATFTVCWVLWEVHLCAHQNFLLPPPPIPFMVLDPTRPRRVAGVVWSAMGDTVVGGFWAAVGALGAYMSPGCVLKPREAEGVGRQLSPVVGLKAAHLFQGGSPVTPLLLCCVPMGTM